MIAVRSCNSLGEIKCWGSGSSVTRSEVVMVAVDIPL